MPTDGKNSFPNEFDPDLDGQIGFTLTKAELADMLFEQLGLNKREAKDMVECFFKEICDSLERGESVKLSGFGNFQLRDKPQRPGRNPKTGEEIPISARRVVTFHASQKLKGQIEEAIVADGNAANDVAATEANGASAASGRPLHSIDASS